MAKASSSVQADKGGKAKAAAALVFQRVRVEPAYKAVSAAIERHILNGDLPPGAPLPTEQVLCERFGVHRSTVREAIRQVEQEGLLQRREGRRLYVALPGLYDLAPRTTRLLLLQRVTFRELWNVAIALEPVAARLAAEHADATDLAQLAKNLKATAALTRQVGDRQGDAARDDDVALVALDVSFHALIGQASHNRALMLAREPVSLFYRPTLFQIHQRLPQSRQRNLEAHRRMVDAIKRRDGAEAADWAHKHMVDFQRGFAMTGLDLDTPIELPQAAGDVGPSAAARPLN